MRRYFLLLLLAFSVGMAAQSYKSRIHYKVEIGDTSQLHQLILLDYTKLLGVVLELKSDEIFFQVRSSSEVSVIPLEELRFLGVFEEKSSNRLARVYTETVGLTDLTYERTALPFQSKSQLRVINLIYAVPEFNLSEHVQLGIGVAGPLGIIGTARLRFEACPKVNVGLSNQTLFPTVGQVGNGGLIVLGDFHVVMTIGDENKFLNLGTGILYNTDEFEGSIWGHRLAVGGRVSPKWHLYGEMLMTLGNDENRFSSRQVTLLPSLNAALSVRRHRWQFGVMSVFLSEDEIVSVPIPYIGYQLYWGDKRMRRKN